jgi:hypothetical protein
MRVAIACKPNSMLLFERFSESSGADVKRRSAERATRVRRWGIWTRW